MEQLSNLVLDFTVYPRTVVDRHHVARLAEALRAGAEFPPIVADKQSRRVVDGFHRVKAYLQVQGPEAAATVKWKTYANEAAFFLDAVALNAHHGLRISRLDEGHCIQLAHALGVQDDELATVLTLTGEKLAEMRARRFATDETGQAVLLKAPNRHLAGHKLSSKQVRGNSRASGMTLAFHIDQVINALESGIADPADTGVVDRLRRLVELAQPFMTEPTNAD